MRKFFVVAAFALLSVLSSQSSQATVVFSSGNPGVGTPPAFTPFSNLPQAASNRRGFGIFNNPNFLLSLLPNADSESVTAAFFEISNSFFLVDYSDKPTILAGRLCFLSSCRLDDEERAQLFADYGLNPAGASTQQNGLFDVTVFDTASAVPEPGTWLLMLTGFAGLAFALRRRSQLPQLAA